MGGFRRPETGSQEVRLGRKGSLSEQPAPISSSHDRLHPLQGGRKLLSVLLMKLTCQAAKIGDKFFLLQTSWFQPLVYTPCIHPQALTPLIPLLVCSYE